MKKNIGMIFAAALAAGLAALPCVHAATSGATPTNAPAGQSANASSSDLMASLFGDTVIAKGKGFEIKQSQLDDVLDALKARAAAMGRSLSPDDLSQVSLTGLETLIGTQILLQQATDADKAQGKKDTDQYVADVIKQIGSQQGLEEQLKAAGKSFDQWQADRLQQATAAAVMIRVLNAAPTEAQIQNFYNTNSAASEVPEQVHVRHILLATRDMTTGAPLTDDQLQAKKKQIDDILKRARGGEDFGKLAKQYSDDTQSKNDGGEMPPFSRNDPVAPEFLAAAFSLTNNQISDVVTTQFGYHIIQLLDKTPAKKLALTDKLPGGNMTLSDGIKDYMTRIKLQALAPAYVEKLSHSPGVEILDPNIKALWLAQTNTLAAIPGRPAALPAQ